jgi:hypothetical protein
LRGKDAILGRTGFVITDLPPQNHEQIELVIIVSTHNKVILNEKKDRIFLFICKDQVANSEIIECIILILFERIMQLKGFFSIHASAVEMNGQAIVFVGDKESGKTSTAIGLCLNKKARLIANDHVYLWVANNQLVCGYGDGKKKVAFRSQAMAKMNHELGTRIFGDNIKKDGVRKKVEISELGIDATEDNVFVGKIVNVGLGKADTPVFRYLNPPDGNLTLYRNIMRVIRGSSLVLFDNERMFDAFLPDFSCEKTIGNLNAFLNFISNKKLVFDYKGSLEELMGIL